MSRAVSTEVGSLSSDFVYGTLGGIKSLLSTLASGFFLSLPFKGEVGESGCLDLGL